eukprot:jgi/Phyca11/535350/estExt2_fgenesh1_pg.C_PHYCAscaffold_340078
MKIVKPFEPTPYLSSERLTRWAYLAFAVSTLYVVERAKNNKIPRENFFGMAASLLPTELSHKIAVMHACVMGFLLKKKMPIFSHWSGAFAGLVQCIVAANLANWYRQNLSSKEVIRKAFSSSDIAPEQLKDIGHMTLKRWLSVFLPLPQPMAVCLSYPGVSKIRTVTYAHVGKTKTKKLLMDVYKHQDAPPDAPIFLYIHGGGWVIGDRRIPPFACVYQVASMGWIVCVIDYRLSPGVAFPAHLIDSKRAVAYLRQNARAEFDANPEFIVVGGESAGGHLASLVGLTADDKSLQPGFEEVDTSVRAVVDNYGVHDFTDRHGIYYSRDKTRGLIHYLEFLVMQKKLKDNSEDFERASPIAYLDDDRAACRRELIPPFMITHGTHDNTVAFKDSRVFFDRLRHYRQNLPQHIASYQETQLGGVQDVFVKVPYASHMFNFLLSPRALAHNDAVVRKQQSGVPDTMAMRWEGRRASAHISVLNCQLWAFVERLAASPEAPALSPEARLEQIQLEARDLLTRRRDTVSINGTGEFPADLTDSIIASNEAGGEAEEKTEDGEVAEAKEKMYEAVNERIARRMIDGVVQPYRGAATANTSEDKSDTLSDCTTTTETSSVYGIHNTWVDLATLYSLPFVVSDSNHRLKPVPPLNIAQEQSHLNKIFQECQPVEEAGVNEDGVSLESTEDGALPTSDNGFPSRSASQNSSRSNDGRPAINGTLKLAFEIARVRLLQNTPSLSFLMTARQAMGGGINEFDEKSLLAALKSYSDFISNTTETFKTESAEYDIPNGRGGSRRVLNDRNMLNSLTRSGRASRVSEHVERMDDQAEIMAGSIRKLMGILLTTETKFDEAKAQFGTALILYKTVGNKIGQAASLSGIGMIHSRNGNLRGAHNCFTKALTF